MTATRPNPLLLAGFAVVVVLAAVMGAFLVVRSFGADRGPQAEDSVSIRRSGDRSEVTHTLRPVADGELPESVTLILPQRIQGVGSPAFRYLSATDGTGTALEMTSSPEDFGYLVTPHRTSEGELSVTFVVQDDAGGAVVPDGRFTGVALTRMRIEREPPEWQCLTLASSKSTPLFRPCTRDGDVLPGPRNSLGNQRWKAPDASLPTVTG